MSDLLYPVIAHVLSHSVALALSTILHSNPDSVIKMFTFKHLIKGDHLANFVCSSTLELTKTGNMFHIHN